MPPPDQLEALRGRVLDLLKREGHPIHTGEIAARLGVPTHMVHSAMHVPLQRREVWFHSSDGYSLPKPVDTPRGSDERQTGIDLA
jgi:hypothetical protein